MVNPDFSNTLILAPTFYKYEKYCDSLIELINRTWHEHPEIYFFSDNFSTEKIIYKNIIRNGRSEWPHVVLHGCKEIRKLFPAVKVILLLNEEAFPLTDINSLKIYDILSIVNRHDLKYVYFPCYANNWKFDKMIDGQHLCETPQDYKYYTQLGPAFWNLDYLIQTCEYAISKNILSPWKFETIVTKETHLISDYQWPTVADGLFVDGYVNLAALKKISNDLKLKKQLRILFLISRPKKISRLLLRKFIGALNKFIPYYKKNPLVYPYRS